VTLHVFDLSHLVHYMIFMQSNKRKCEEIKINVQFMRMCSVGTWLNEMWITWVHHGRLQDTRDALPCEQAAEISK
jgi:hypothetical protein